MLVILGSMFASLSEGGECWKAPCSYSQCMQCSRSACFTAEFKTNIPQFLINLTSLSHPKSCPFKRKEKPENTSQLWTLVVCLLLGGEEQCVCCRGIKQLKKNSPAESGRGCSWEKISSRRNVLLAASATEGLFSLWCRPAFPVSLCSVMRMVTYLSDKDFSSHKCFWETLFGVFRKWCTLSYFITK